MSNQRPSVGRVVHVCWSGQRIAAMITYVHSDTCINARLQSGAGIEESSLLLATEDDASKAMPNNMTTPHRTWSWPPFVPGK